MPSTAQRDDTETPDDYLTDAHRFVDRKPKQVVLSIKPMTLENAKDWIGACNAYGDQEMVEHFVAEANHLK